MPERDPGYWRQSPRRLVRAEERQARSKATTQAPARYQVMTFETAVAVLAHSRNDVGGVVIFLCRTAGWAAVAGRQRESDDAIEIAANLMEERAFQARRLKG